MSSVAKFLASITLLLGLTACGGGANWSDQKAFVTVGGTVAGLTGTVTLRNNGGDDLAVTASGPFTFKLSIANGASYAVTVASQPAGQFCTVTNGSGTANADVTGVTVNCISDATIGGTVSGLNGTLVLQNNGGNNLATATNGTFQFTQKVAAGRPYAVSVLTHPEGQTCTVANASGTANANVTNVAVTCTTFVPRALPAIYTTGKALAYGPFRAGGPGAGEMPTDAQIAEDLQLMSNAGFDLIRLFGSDAVSDKILRIATANHPAMRFQLGIYLQGASAPACTDSVNNAQIATGIQLARTYANVATVSVGNETSFANNLPVSCLDKYLREVRSQVLQPVTADDDYTFFAGRAANGSKPDAVVKLVDFVAIHMYPMSNAGRWDWQQTAVAAGPARAQAMMNASRDEAVANYNAVANYSYTAPGGSVVTIGATRPIVVGETGWKARQTNNASAIEGYAARPQNAKWYQDLMRAWERSAGGPATVFYFSAFDESWKGSDDGWGLWDAARSARYALCGTAVGGACNADLYAGAGYFGALAPATGSYKVLDFANTGIGYTLSPFGGEAAALTTTGVPAGGPAGQVLQINRAAGSQCWAGTTMSVGYLLSVGRIPFAPNATTMTARLYAPAAGMSIKVKVENAENGGVSVETDTLTQVAGWQTLTFDFANQSPGTAALDVAATYNKISLFPNFSCATGASPVADEIFFIADVTFIGANAPSAPPLVPPGPPPAAAAYTIIDFDNPAVTAASFGAEGGGVATSGNYPAGGPTGNVFQLGRGGSPDRSFCWSGTTFGVAADFTIPAVPFSANATRISLQIYSPSALPIVRMKLETAGGGATVEADQPLAVGWQTVTFDFATPAAGTPALDPAATYNKLSIFPGFSCAGPWGTPNELGVDTVFFIGPIRFLGANPVA